MWPGGSRRAGGSAARKLSIALLAESVAGYERSETVSSRPARTAGATMDRSPHEGGALPAVDAGAAVPVATWLLVPRLPPTGRRRSLY